MKNIFLGVALAPYRLDFYNYLSQNFNCNIYFQMKTFDGQLFSTDKLIRKCTYTPLFLETRSIGNRKIIKQLEKIIKKDSPDIVFVPEFSPITIQVILYRYLTKKNFKIVSVCDDSYDMLMGNSFSKAHHYARKVLMPYIDEIVLVDKKAVNWYQWKYKKGIWMPIIRDESIMLPYLNTINNKAHEIKQTYGEKKILLFVGRLIDVKNIPLLLKAYKKISNEYKLVIIGDGEKKHELKQQCESLNIHVQFVGQKNGDDLYIWYKVADIFILPSYREAFGAVVNEALLSGCKCIVSKVAGSSCLITEGVNGYTFDPHSVDDLVTHIKQLSKELPDKKVSQMTVSFSECMENLIQTLNNIKKKL